MAMNVGRRGGTVASINMTPMIDVLLVLLIIFMVMQGQLQRGLSLQIPPNQPETTVPPADPDQSLVLEVAPGGVYRLNQQAIPRGALQSRLAGVFAERNRKVLFVKADERATYQEVITAVEASRAAGVAIVGLVPRGGS